MTAYKILTRTMLATLILAAQHATAQTPDISTTLPMTGSVVKACDGNIQYVGRVRENADGSMAFNYPGTEIRARFRGSSLKMVCRPMTGFFMAQIDGKEPFKVSFNGQRDSVVSLATALPTGDHTVRLMYAIEGLFRQPVFKGFVLDDGCRLATPEPLPERRIEFIGNSITCGYGVESTNAADPFEDETENHFLTYANLVSEQLGALHTSISRSGIGVYRNYNGPREGSKLNMTRQWAYTLFNDSSELWDFSRYQPDLVCINLGTNDLSTPNFDLARYEQAYRNFLADVRGKYPSAKIVLLTGPMLGEPENGMEKRVLNRICADFHKHGDKEIFRFDFKPQTGSLGFGGGWHPSKKQHEAMAAELLPFLRKLMGW